jgi:hypothetical protein
MWQPAIGGLIIGGVIVVVPQVMGVGYEYIDQALNGGLLLRTLIALCVVKLAATVISYSSGNGGGIFAPSLYIGAMAGGALGTVVHQVAPFPTAGAGAYALVGMGTLFAGIIRAPMTSVFMIFEITQDYQILVPLMVANMLAFTISKRLQPAPVYHALLQQDGVHLPEVDLSGTSTRTAGSIMHPRRRCSPLTCRRRERSPRCSSASRRRRWSVRMATCLGSSPASSWRPGSPSPLLRTRWAQWSAISSYTCIPTTPSTSSSNGSPEVRDCCRWSAAPTSAASSAWFACGTSSSASTTRRRGPTTSLPVVL